MGVQGGRAGSKEMAQRLVGEKRKSGRVEGAGADAARAGAGR